MEEIVIGVQGLALAAVILAIVLAIAWIVLPFATIGTSTSTNRSFPAAA
jgi:hypothetical protein